MNGLLSRKLLLAFFLLCAQQILAQYILNGSAQKISCNCYTLTEEKMTQSGSVWNSNKISLATSFDFWFNVFLGCKDATGADGIVFILQPISTSVGTTGEGMGFGGVQPSVGIALDTWQNFNLNDPDYDHISIQKNGIIDHNSDLAGPVPISANSNNVEDCKWHVLRIAWDAPTQTLTAYFDGVLRVQKQVDLVSTIFNGDPRVYWGFTGATGGAVNLQQFCTALNPLFSVNGNANGGCVDKPISFRDSSESFAPIVSYNWSFGDGTFSTDRNPPTHTYPSAGEYLVNLKIKGQDGCEKDSTSLVTVGSVPAAELLVGDTCFHFLPALQFIDRNIGVSYQWSLDGNLLTRDRRPQLPLLNPGAHELDVSVSSLFNCGPAVTKRSGFTIRPLPQVEAQVEDGCINQDLSFTGIQHDNQTTVSEWHWNFGEGSSAVSQRTFHRYSLPRTYPVQLWATSTNGCVSDTFATSVGVNAAVAVAGNDTAVIKDLPFQLHGQGNGAFLWSPATGLSDPAIANPVATLGNDQQYILTVTTAEGCRASDTLLIRTFNGPAIYVPSAFTPNGDGKNESLRPVYVGIKQLKQFAVFNRWGQLVFTTNNMQAVWEGSSAPVGTYVWLIRAINSLGKEMILKGTVTLIR